MARETVDSFIKNYTITDPMSATERGAKFLNDLALKFPRDFVSKPKLAKIMFNLPSVPRDSNECMKRVPHTIQGVDRILQNKYKRRIKSDRVDGYRATTDDNDLMIHVVRVQVRRANLAQTRVNHTVQMINPRNLAGGLKKEFEDVRDTFKLIGEKVKELPQLPAPSRNGNGPNSAKSR